MSRIAIDIVVLPPEKVMDQIIKINQSEAIKGNAKGELNKNDFLPHISLAMGIVDESKFVQVTEIVTSITKSISPVKLELIDYYFVVGEDGIKSYAIKVGGQLHYLHKQLMSSLKNYFTHDATKEDMYNQETEPNYVNTYKKNDSFKNYVPHITIRCKEINTVLIKQEFIADRIAICHIGKSTTCRKILFETKLKNKKR
ncbi:hypothetical protein COY27_01460 [Candidatus Woesearchaeota archaeon CG_4_10_14_0_2_um_filter_33_13]|nr:MAG: hypothetical protein COY27_01460 [Candidatus Woesearchaeota archaeon CG_4_10_14_0_2_um_filter_33_13]